MKMTCSDIFLNSRQPIAPDICASNILFFSPEILSSRWCSGESFALHARGLGFEPGRMEPGMPIFFCFYVVESFKEYPAHRLPLPIVSQLSKCVKFEAVWGGGVSTDQITRPMHVLLFTEWSIIIT